MKRYFLKLNGENHCPDGVCHPEKADQWERGVVLVPNASPQIIVGNKLETAPEIEVGDELWIWTHEHEAHGSGWGFTAKATVENLNNKGEFITLELTEVALLLRPFGFRSLGEGPTGSRLLDYVNAHRHHQSYLIEETDYVELQRVVEKWSAPLPDEVQQAYTGGWDQAISEHKQSLLDQLANRREGLHKARAGQHAFRAALLERHKGQCVISGCNVGEALEAAHVVPHTGDPIWDMPENGLLLRRDIHTLFDAMLLTIHPRSGRVRLAEKLKGTSYDKLHGIEVSHQVPPELLNVHFIQFGKVNSDD